MRSGKVPSAQVSIETGQLHPHGRAFIQAAGEMENPAIRSYVDELRAPSPALAPIIDLRGRVSWHGSDRLDGTVRARESGQVAA